MTVRCFIKLILKARSNNCSCIRGAGLSYDSDFSMNSLRGKEGNGQ